MPAHSRARVLVYVCILYKATSSLHNHRDFLCETELLTLNYSFFYFLCWTFGHRRTRLRSTNSTSYRLTWGVFDLCINLRLLHTTCELILTCMRRSTPCCFRLCFCLFCFLSDCDRRWGEIACRPEAAWLLFFFLGNCLCVLKGTGNRPPPLWCLTTWHTSRQPHYVPVYLCNLSYYGNIQLFFSSLTENLKT